MRSRFIQNEILVLLSDKNVHTAQEIADTLEISVRTVYRHINDLSGSYPITTGCSSAFRGIRLLYNNPDEQIFSEWEISFLISISPMDKNESKAKRLLKKLYDLKQASCFE